MKWWMHVGIFFYQILSVVLFERARQHGGPTWSAWDNQPVVGKIMGSLPHGFANDWLTTCLAMARMHLQKRLAKAKRRVLMLN